MTRIPPQNIEAEQSVLGAILLDNESLDLVTEQLDTEDFYQENHRRIFSAMKVLKEKGMPVDLVTLPDQLDDDKTIEKIGGRSYIAYLSDSVPTAANVGYYTRIVREKSLLRKLIETGTSIVDAGYTADGDVNELIDGAEASVYQLAQRDLRKALIPLKDVITDSFSKIESLFERKESITGVPSGFTDLDKLTSGFQSSDLIIIAARPSMGKTTLALNIASYVSASKMLPVAFFSLEMSKEQLAMRLLCAEAYINSVKLRTGRLDAEDWPRLAAAAGKLAEAKLYIDDTPAITVNEIRSKLRRMKHESGLRLVVIDYLQLLNVRGNIQSREQEISLISRSLKAMAKELDVPVIALSQLNRAVEARQDKRPMMSDLRESGAIEQDADIIGFIYRDEQYHPDTDQKGIAEVLISKHRNGATGMIKLRFFNDHTRFENLET